MSWTPLIVERVTLMMMLRGAGQAVVRVRVFLRRLPPGGEGRR
jgi:hypothetical protein